MAWRTKARAAIGYTGKLYDDTAFAYVRRAFVSTKILLWDERFYDPATGKYKVDDYLAEGQRRFGGYDHVLLWHSFPRLGFDERNQFDFYRDMPGGLAGIKKLVEQFHTHGIKVSLNYNPWDSLSRREGMADNDALQKLVDATGADGIYLDTWHNGARSLFDKLNHKRRGIALETENNQCLLDVEHHHCELLEEYYWDGYAPGIIRNKWMERRHMMHVDLRMERDKIPFIQLAWMNGTGVLVWENLFSQWQGWSEQEARMLKSMAAIQRRYSDVFASEGWEPFVKTEQPGVFASRWHEKGVELYTLVNRKDAPVAGPLLRVHEAAGMRYYDLISGARLDASVPDQDKVRAAQGLEIEGSSNKSQALLAGRLDARGLAAILAVPEGSLTDELRTFLFNQATQYNQPHPNNWRDKVEPGETLNPVPPTYTKASSLKGMVLLPATERVTHVEPVKTPSFYLYNATPLVRPAYIPTLLMDTAPVTNAAFFRFLQASGYKPKQAHNFLKHWGGAVPPNKIADAPVMYVDLTDARAYAAWAGKRLPTEDEWMYGLQSTKVGYSTKRCWEWNESERSNGQTRWCVLHGGSDYAVHGIHYADGGPMLPQKGSKFILMWPGLDRCSTITFRCVADVAVGKYNPTQPRALPNQIVE